MKELEGVFEATRKGFGFVKDIDNEDDIFIPHLAINGAFDMDRVLVKVTSKGEDGKKSEGVIVKILERNMKKIVGKFSKSRNFGFVIPNNKKISSDIFIPKNVSMKAKDGDIVVAEITKWPSKIQKAEGKIVEILGKPGDVGVDILAIMSEYDIEQDFPKEVLEETDKIPDTIADTEYKKRVDLRREKMVTIDSEDAKDLDDAVSVKRLCDGKYLLGVHIADVSFYVTEQSALDKEALKRGTSTYLVDRVIPMLPTKLSNGVCSLNAGVDRLAFSVYMIIDKTGNLIDSTIFKSVINVDRRMTYTDVTKILENTDKKVINKYKDFVEDFKVMEELSDILRKKRQKRGSIDFNIPEAKVILDKSGKPIDIKKYEITISNNIIEDFMLMANETVAEKFCNLGVPFVYRIHEKPDKEKIEDFAKFIFNYGYQIKNIEKITPASFRQVLKKIEGKPEERVISTLLLRCMQQAKYSDENMGHFGLAAKYYCHFTSPIRRYPDLFIHRVMGELVSNNYKFINEKTKKRLKKKAVIASKISSEMERNSQYAERESVELKEAEYMKQFVGDLFTGVISGVTSFGFFVELPNTIEGLVRVEDLIDDYYIYNEKRYALVGERTHKVYRIGDIVKVKLAGVNVSERKIDFVVA